VGIYTTVALRVGIYTTVALRAGIPPGYEHRAGIPPGYEPRVGIPLYAQGGYPAICPGWVSPLYASLYALGRVASLYTVYLLLSVHTSGPLFYKDG